MKIIEPSAVLMRDFDGNEVMKFIEKCGRTCYQSEKNITEDSAEKFVRNLIKRGHESVLEHFSATFKIICDRGVMAELTRHRLASFSVESTRYNKYDDLKIIMPTGWEPTYFLGDGGIKYEGWGVKDEIECVIFHTELTYKTLLGEREKQHNINLPPEQARAVLPLCLATEIIMTANLREWRHILKLRTDKAAHPQMRQVANMILEVLKEKLPIVFEDIGEK